MAARGDDTSTTAARGVDSKGTDINSGSVVMTVTGILMTGILVFFFSDF